MFPAVSVWTTFCTRQKPEASEDNPPLHVPSARTVALKLVLHETDSESAHGVRTAQLVPEHVNWRTTVTTTVEASFARVPAIPVMKSFQGGTTPQVTRHEYDVSSTVGDGAVTSTIDTTGSVVVLLPTESARVAVADHCPPTGGVQQNRMLVGGPVGVMV